MSENSTNGIDVLLEKKFKRHLKKDEHIVWTGTSLEGYESGWIFSEKSLHLVFGLLVGIMTLMFTLPSVLVDGEINFIAVAILAVCVLIVVNSFRKPKLKKAFFAVTNKRILTLIWGQLFQTALKDVVSAELRQRTVYESGMLIEANDVVFTVEKFSGNVRQKDYIGGFSEENAENVCYIIESESSKAHMYV